MEHEHDIDDLFQKSFENFEIPPPDEVKRKIDEALFEKRKRRFFGFWLLGGISLAGSIILAILLLYKPGSENLLAKAEKQEKQDHTVKGREAQEKENENAGGTPDLKEKEKPGNLSGEDQTSTHESATDQTATNNKQIKNKNTSGKNLNQTQSSSDRKAKNKKPKRRKKNGLSNPLFIEQIIANADHNGNSTGDENQGRDPEKEKEKPENTDAAEQIATATNDSLANAQKTILAQKDDTSENDSLAENYEIPERKKPEPQKLSPFLVGVQFGLTKAVNRSDKTTTFGENNPLYINLDASYRRRKIGASTGFNYFSTSESVSHTFTSKDSILLSVTYDYIMDDSTQYFYDTNQVAIDSIVYTYVVDTIANETYQVNTNTSTESSVYRVSYFSIPFMLSYQQRIFSKLYLDLMAGGVISYQKLKFTGNNPANNNVTLSELGFRLCVKTNLRYQFSKFGVSLNSNFNYDLKPVQYLQQTRKRQAVDFGVGIWYNF